MVTGPFGAEVVYLRAHGKGHMTLSWYAAVGYGAIGGLIVEAVAFWGRLSVWQQARHQALAANEPKPSLREFVDPGADIAVALTRALLGCAMGALLQDQVTGAYAAVAVGAAAPGLLTQLGTKTTLPKELGE